MQNLTLDEMDAVDGGIVPLIIAGVYLAGSYTAGFVVGTVLRKML